MHLGDNNKLECKKYRHYQDLKKMNKKTSNSWNKKNNTKNVMLQNNLLELYLDY